MKCIILLAIIAFTKATPLVGWRDVYEPQKWGSPTYHNSDKVVAHQVAEQVTQQVLHDQLVRTHEAIENLHGQLQQYPGRSPSVYPQRGPWSWIPQNHVGVEAVQPYRVGTQIDQQLLQHNDPVVTANAIQHLQDDFVHQLHQWTGTTTEPQNEQVQQLQDTIEAAVQAQIIVDAVHHQQTGQGVSVPSVNDVHASVFHARIQKLADQYNQEEIEKEISHHHHWVQQLHYQQQFINQQKQKIEAEQVLIQHQGVSPQQVQQLEQVHHQLQTQEYHLIQEQLAHHVAIWTLQQSLVHQVQKVQQDTVAEYVHEDAVHENNPWSWQRSWTFWN